MTQFLKEAYWRGLTELDTDQLRKAAVDHVYTEEERETGVISPSLVATSCRLARLKRFLGQESQPGSKRMATRAGEADPVTNLNFLRGFQMEGVIVACLKHTLGERILGHAPSLYVYWKDPELGYEYAGHPDLLVIDDDGLLANVQIKTPSVFKFERVERNQQDAFDTYWPQMATEMFILRKAGFPVERTYLMLATWEATAKMSKPRVIVVDGVWEEAAASIPELCAAEVYQDVVRAAGGVWPDALPQQQWDVFPCSYCRYPRLGTHELAGCEDHQAWQLEAEGKPWNPLERSVAQAGGGGGRAGRKRTRGTTAPSTPSNVIPLVRRGTRRRNAEGQLEEQRPDGAWQLVVPGTR